MWTKEYSEETTVPRQAIWEAWADVSRWPLWNPDIAAIELEGPFADGSRITMTPLGSDPVELVLVDVAEGSRFVDEARLGATVIRTTHEIVEAADGDRNRLIYRLEATGPMADELGPAISADFPETIAGLIEFAGRAAADAPA
ncbi:MAG TPA: SRPBCC family protein [Solirubrobacteraceae bacterium]|nr:SRPBCC family protein [Solirubrobacteraceae bacterium]